LLLISSARRSNLSSSAVATTTPFSSWVFFVAPRNVHRGSSRVARRFVHPAAVGGSPLLQQGELDFSPAKHAAKIRWASALGLSPREPFCHLSSQPKRKDLSCFRSFSAQPSNPSSVVSLRGSAVGGSPLLEQGELDFSPAKHAAKNMLGFSPGPFAPRALLSSVIPTEAEGSLLPSKFRATVKSVFRRGLTWVVRGWEPPASAGGAGLQSSETRCKNTLGFSPGPFAREPFCHLSSQPKRRDLSCFRSFFAQPSNPSSIPGDLCRASTSTPSRISTQTPPTIPPESATPS